MRCSTTGTTSASTRSYHDALFKKKSRVIPAIVESTGGVTPHFAAQIGILDRRAKSKGGRDSTKYGLSRTSAKSYFVHHLQQIACAAVLGNARAIRKSIRARKQALLAEGALAGGA